MQNFAQAESGQRTDLASGELPQNFAEVAGKETREIAAEKAGFGNAETYLNNQTDLVPVNLPEPPDSQQEMANYQPLIFRQNQRNLRKN